MEESRIEADKGKLINMDSPADVLAALIPKVPTRHRCRNNRIVLRRMCLSSSGANTARLERSRTNSTDIEKTEQQGEKRVQGHNSRNSRLCSHVIPSTNNHNSDGCASFLEFSHVTSVSRSRHRM